MAKGKALLAGFVVGGVVSAMATLLNAPSSGKELRIRAKQQSAEWKEMIGDLSKKSMRLKEQLASTSKEGTTLVKELTQEMKQSVQDWKSSVEPHQENIKKYLEQIEASLKDLEVKMQNEEEKY